ncbi:SCO family protein [Modestobacter sp. VKM Ac-2984]|uniref:SCO family protein n=1 Tax=Modestobacter sp. VKM Ac-2984 TaxID=3004138 RepID=UPI0022AB12AD|nr:SCO family protein [Modestobacter sp. VKM Ac-2984]MCZ2818007.1 SCO family protein [Modestobacter sp. VKM Ac-2984]
MRAVPGRAALGSAILVGGLLLTGCGQGATGAAQASAAGGASISADDDGFHGTLVQQAQPRPDLTLPTTSGELFDLGDRPEDEITLLFFGYTHCPDLCPTTMADLALARDMLDPGIRDRVQVVFVTEDPARDTPEALREWLDRFDPEFTGLIGGNEATAAALRELYLPESAQVADPSTAIVHPHEGGEHAAEHEQGGGGDSHGDYGVDHAGAVYAWGPDGQSVVYTGGTAPGQYAEDLARLAATD